MGDQVLLSVRGLGKRYGAGCERCGEHTGPEHSTNMCPECGSVTAVNGVSFDLKEGEILGVVGESGSGKSTLVQCIYFDQDATQGKIRVTGHGGGGDILGLPRSEKRKLRGRLMGMVYQNPLRGLRMDITSGANVAEKLLEADIFHLPASGKEPQGSLLGRRYRGRTSTVSPSPSPAGCSNGSRSQKRLRTTRRSCCWTKSPRAWT